MGILRSLFGKKEADTEPSGKNGVDAEAQVHPLVAGALRQLEQDLLYDRPDLNERRGGCGVARGTSR